MSDQYDKERRARDQTAKEIKEGSRGRLTSEQAHQIAKEAAQRVDRKKKR